MGRASGHGADPQEDEHVLRQQARQEALRPEAGWIWRSDEASVPQKSKDYEKDLPPSGVHRVRVQKPGGHQALQALRAAGREQEEAEGPALRLLSFLFISG